MNRKTVWILMLLTLGSVYPAGVQQPKKIPRIGYLFVGLQPSKEFLQAMGKLDEFGSGR